MNYRIYPKVGGQRGGTSDSGSGGSIRRQHSGPKRAAQSTVVSKRDDDVKDKLNATGGGPSVDPQQSSGKTYTLVLKQHQK